MKISNLLLLLTVGATVGSASAQSNYDFTKMQREKLNRGVVAVRENPGKVAVSWRYLSSDPKDQAFDIYRDGKKINSKPVTKSTFFTDNYTGTAPASYVVKPLKGDKSEGSYTLPANAPEGYINIPLNVPERGVDVWGKEYTYVANMQCTSRYRCRKGLSE